MIKENLKIEYGANLHQNANFESNTDTIDYETSRNLSYSEVLSIVKGLDTASEFYDVNAVITTKNAILCAVALGKDLEDALLKVMDSNPIDFMNSIIICTQKVDSEIARKLKSSNLIVAPEYTGNAKEFLDNHCIGYVTIKTPLKDYKNYLSENVINTPMGVLTQAPNRKELDKDSFKVVTTQKPTVEQIEDAVFAWKVAKHSKSQAIVIAKDLKTTALAQGLQSATVEYALDYSCDMSKEAILASDMPITIHDLNVAAQGRISTVIVPSADAEIISAANKYNMSIITTGFTNILY